MRKYQGIIFAYREEPGLRELTSNRTAASLPFCGRYRLIDFPLSSLRNAGVLDVGVIMQRDYQSLLDHIGNGKAWDMSRRSGGLRMLPPFGLPEYHRGNYAGTMEALNAVASYVQDIPARHIVLMLGDLCANLDLRLPMAQHRRSGASVTAICTDRAAEGFRMTYRCGADGRVCDTLIGTADAKEGLISLEAYIINKDVLLAMMDHAREHGLHRFHRDVLLNWIRDGGDMDVYIHSGYAALIRTVDSYYRANMDMLDPAVRRGLFPADRPVYTKIREEVSTYYGEQSSSRNCLVADNCIIEGSIENCIVFSGARIARGARLRNCIVMRGCTVGADAALDFCIVDKDVSLSPGTVLTGGAKLPFVIPKGSRL